MNSSNRRERMVSDLVVAGMANRTREAYLRAVQLLSRFYKDSDPSTLTEEQVKDYILWMRNKRSAAPGILESIGSLAGKQPRICSSKTGRRRC